MAADPSKTTLAVNPLLQPPPLIFKLAVTCAVVALFVPSLYLPAFWARGGFFEGGTELLGWQLLLFGWFPPFTVLWPANALLYDSQRRFWRGSVRASVIEAGIAVGQGITALLVVFDSPGNRKLLVGYSLWEGSLAVGFVGVSFYSLSSRNRRRQGVALTVVEVDRGVNDEQFFAGRPPFAGEFRPDARPIGKPFPDLRHGLARRLFVGVTLRAMAALPVALFAVVQYQSFLQDRRMNRWREPYVALGPLYFLANQSPADDWIGYLLLAVAVPCLLAVVAWPRRWTVLLACAAALAWVVPGCIDAPGGP